MLVRKTCTLIAVVCVAAACFAQAASALDLNTVTPPPIKPQQKPDWAGFYFRKQFERIRSVDGAHAVHRFYSTYDTARTPTSENFGYNFQSGNVVFGLEGSLAAANFDGKFTAPYCPRPRRAAGHQT